MTKIGVVSDTHVRDGSISLPDELLSGFEDVDLIIHAGDIACYAVLEELSSLAPVEAVYGNVDPDSLCRQLEEKMVLELENYRIGILHGFQLNGKIYNAGYVFPDADIIIFGHTHRPCNREMNGKIFFNPGSPTDKRLQSSLSYGTILLKDKPEFNIIEF